MEMPKTKEEFECLMKARSQKYHHDAGYMCLIRCNLDGTPADAESKRKVCEIQKIAIGSDTAYMYCTEVFHAPHDIKMVYDTVIPEGTLVRRVVLEMSEKEMKSWNRLYYKQISGVKPKRSTESLDHPSGAITMCAFPGGCE